MPFICFLFRLLFSQLEPVELSLWDNYHSNATQFTPLQIWKRHARLLGTHARGTKTKIWVIICGHVHLQFDENQTPKLHEGKWSGASDDRDMPPFILLHRFTFNIEAYIKCHGGVVLTWIKRVAIGSSYVWQKDLLKQENRALPVRKFQQQDHS